MKKSNERKPLFVIPKQNKWNSWIENIQLNQKDSDTIIVTINKNRFKKELNKEFKKLF